jgi:hypothetical protein
LTNTIGTLFVCWNAITAAGQQAQSNGYANVLLDGIDVQKVEVYIPISGPILTVQPTFQCRDCQVFITSRIDTYLPRSWVFHMTNKVEPWPGHTPLNRLVRRQLLWFDPHETTCSGEFT